MNTRQATGTGRTSRAGCGWQGRGEAPKLMCVFVWGVGLATLKPPLRWSPTDSVLVHTLIDEVWCPMRCDLQDRLWPPVWWMPPRLKMKQGSRQWSRGTGEGRGRGVGVGVVFPGPTAAKSPGAH